MDKKPIIASIVVLILATLVIVYVPKRAEDDLSEKTEVSTEIQTEEQKTSEIATESVTEAPTIIIAQVTTEEIIETTEENTEETTGDIDINGYGWVQLQYSATYHISGKHLTREGGVFYYAGHKETWYSTNEAAGKTTARNIPGKHVADDGTIRDEDGFICVASSDLAFYSIVMTSLGPGKVYDCGCSSGTIDVYTNW